MSILDELKKWTHPYEDEDEEYDDFEEPTRREPAFHVPQCIADILQRIVCVGQLLCRLRVLLCIA